MERTMGETPLGRGVEIPLVTPLGERIWFRQQLKQLEAEDVQHISTPWLLYRNGPHLRDSFFGDSRLKSVEVCASARFRSTKSCWRGSSLGRRRWANLELLSRWCFFPQWEIFGNPLNWGNLFGNISLFFLGLSDQQLRLNLACTIQLEPGSPRSSSA